MGRVLCRELPEESGRYRRGLRQDCCGMCWRPPSTTSAWRWPARRRMAARTGIQLPAAAGPAPRRAHRRARPGPDPGGGRYHPMTANGTTARPGDSRLDTSTGAYHLRRAADLKDDGRRAPKVAMLRERTPRAAARRHLGHGPFRGGGGEAPQDASTDDPRSAAMHAGSPSVWSRRLGGGGGAVGPGASDHRSATVATSMPPPSANRATCSGTGGICGDAQTAETGWRPSTLVGPARSTPGVRSKLGGARGSTVRPRRQVLEEGLPSPRRTSAPTIPSGHLHGHLDTS